MTKISILKINRVCRRRAGLDGACRACIRRRCRRLPDHQDRHQPVLRQDEGRRDRQGQGTRRRRCKAYAGKIDGDNESQVAAIESCIADGAKGILIMPSDTKAIVPTVKKARDAGMLVIALDTPLDPIDAADATFATDNFKAGKLIGAWAEGDARRQGQGRQDRLPRPQPEPADGRRSARPGLHDGLRHRHQGPQQDRRRGRSAHRLPRRHQRQRGRRPQGDGEPPAEGPGHQRRLHHQRAGRRRRL